MKQTEQSFDDCFKAVFDSGVADIKFFVRPNPELTVEALRKEALDFQGAVDCGNVTSVDSVDADIDQVDFESDW